MTSQLANDMTGRIAIVGHRSFIAQALADELVRRGTPAEPVFKSALGEMDLSKFDCVYLVLGRARPSLDEEAAECDQLEKFLSGPGLPRRGVYVSSMRQTDGKRRCEERIRKFESERRIGTSMFVVRPPAVFGPGQDLWSEMLIPSLVRSRGDVELTSPNVSSPFVSVADLARHLADFVDLERCQVDSPCDIPGTFRVTPHNVRELYRAFLGLIDP